MRWCRAELVAGLSLAALFVSVPGRADPLPSVNLRGFQPPTAPDGSLYMEPAMTPGPWNWNAAGMLSWAYRPVVLRNSNGDTIANLVGSQMSFDFLAGTGIGKRGAVGLALPAVIAQSGQSTPQTPAVLGDSSLPTQALGDLAITGKATVIPQAPMGGFGLAALGRLTLPTGERTSYASEGAVTSELRMLAELRLIAVSAQATAGFKLRTEERTFAGQTWGNEIPWGVALNLFPRAFGLDRDGKWTWTAEAHGALPAGPASPFTNVALSPAVFGLSARRAIGDMSLFAGAEAPLDGAAGVPLTRLVAGVSWAPRVHDVDSDGVPDDSDECMELAEDKDGFEDTDGCPDFDNDEDGVPDKQDRCAGPQEDLDEYQDEDGCPDLDNDGDGIADEQDQCPVVPGVRTGEPGKLGCPVVDQDGDGVADGQDKCPAEAEDKDGFEDSDGCPDLDNDADDIPDGQDACPKEPGAPSNIPSRNGCPVRDADGDTLEDDVDKCPQEPETWNGVSDDDGCADQGGKALLVVAQAASGPTLALRERIAFKGSDTAFELDPKSLPSLRAIAAELNKHPAWIVAVGVKPLAAHGAMAETNAMARSFAIAQTLRTYSSRDGAAETIGWDAVRTLPGAARDGVGFLVLEQPSLTMAAPPAPPAPSEAPAPATK